MRKFSNTPVSLLLLACSPSAIRWLVVAIAVYAVQAVVQAGALSHVGQEVFKAVPPSANTDASPAIPMVGGVVDVEAATPHGTPAFVFGSAAKTMRSFKSSHDFFLPATAGCCESTLEISSTNILGVPAIASAPPFRECGRPSEIVGNDKSAESLAKKVLKVGGLWNWVCCVHVCIISYARFYNKGFYNADGELIEVPRHTDK